MSPSLPSLTLHNGSAIPLLGFGTYKVGVVPLTGQEAAGPKNFEEGKEVLKTAIREGYRMLDCAQFYLNEDIVGAAVKEMEEEGIRREDLFIVSKCWNDTTFGGEEAIRRQVSKSLKELQTSYLDLYLVHWPVPGKHVEAYLTLQKLKKEGLVKEIGVSNYSIEAYQELRSSPGFEEKPVLNQIQVNPLVFRKKTLDFFKAEGIAIMSYRGITQGSSWPQLEELARKLGKSNAQVLGRFLVQQGIVHIPKSSRRERMIENFSLFDFDLSEEDMERLRGMRTEEAIRENEEHFKKCVVRDTPLTSEDADRIRFTSD